MLSLRKTMLMLMVCLCTYATTNAQSNNQAKPKLFAAFPSVLNIQENSLERIFEHTAGRLTVLDFGNNLIIPCTIIRNDVKYDNLQTVIIRASAFDNAMIQVSKILNEDKTISYTGRIINERAADGFEIRKNSNGSYQLQKFETDKILEGCFL